MGTTKTPVIPPALIADIAGGCYPAVMNILLALRQRDQTGTGCYLDIAMAENLFPFMYWGIGEGLGAEQWPRNGANLVTGGSPRYQLYPTMDGRFVAAAPLEQKFWDVFTEVIGLEPEWCDDAVNSKETLRHVKAIIVAKDAAYWEKQLGGADCCCSIVKTLKEALDDPHFIARGVFSESIVNDRGDGISALPVPIASRFRARKGERVAAPLLGADNEELLS